MKKVILYLILLMLILSSCSITKRKYTGGYSFQWHKAPPKVIKLENKLTKESCDISASIDKPIPIEIKQPTYMDSTLCDEITLLDGTLIKGKVEEIGVSEIKYKDCDNLTGPITDIEKSTVFMIRYANGKRTVINTAIDNTTKNDDEYKNIVLTPEQQKLVDDANKSSMIENTDKPGQGLATAALILGILALVAYYGSFVFGLLSIIFGASALSRMKKSGDYSGKGMATAGLVLGIVAMAIWAIILLIII